MDKWLRNTNVIKVMALLIGILLWAVVRFNVEPSPATGGVPFNNSDKIYNVSITPKYDANQYYIKSIEPSQVNISLRGRASDLKKVDVNSYQIELDLTTVSAGQHTLPLRPVGFPSGVEVDIFPQTVRVAIEEKQKKEVPVAIMLTGEPAAGYKAGQPIVKPNRVHVTVPSSQLDAVDSARAEINVTDAKSAITKQVKLIAYDKNGNEVEGIIINPPVVDVEVPITSPFKTMPLQVNIIGQTPPGYSVSSYKQSAEQVTVYGRQDILDQLEFYNGLQVDLSGLTANKTWTMDIPLKPNITRVDPDKMTVDVTVVPSETRILPSLPVTISGQNDGYTTTIVNPANAAVDLELEGAKNLLDPLTIQDIQAFIDVSNLPPGRHEVPLQLNLPTFIKLGPQQQPLKISVEISAKDAAATGG